MYKGPEVGKRLGNQSTWSNANEARSGDWGGDEHDSDWQDGGVQGHQNLTGHARMLGLIWKALKGFNQGMTWWKLYTLKYCIIKVTKIGKSDILVVPDMPSSSPDSFPFHPGHVTRFFQLFWQSGEAMWVLANRMWVKATCGIWNLTHANLWQDTSCFLICLTCQSVNRIYQRTLRLKDQWEQETEEPVLMNDDVGRLSTRHKYPLWTLRKRALDFYCVDPLRFRDSFVTAASVLYPN